MKKAVLFLTVLTVSSAFFSALADEYIVYKANYKINRYTKDVKSGEWLYDKKVDHLGFTGYFIFQKDFNTAGDNAPARIIVVKTKKKYYPAVCEVDTGGKYSWEADLTQKAVNRLIVYPYTVTWCDKKTETTVEQNYIGTEADFFYVFGGLWDTVTIEPSRFKGHPVSMIDYYGDSKFKLSVESPLENVDFSDYNDSEKLVDPENLVSYAEFYSGLVKKDNQPPKMVDGFLSYYTPETITKSKQANLKYDKKVLEKAENKTGITADSMKNAVRALTKYLVSKKYASTWYEASSN